MSYLHEWGTTAMFGLGTVGSCLATEMGEALWDIEVFQVCDHYSRDKFMFLDFILWLNGTSKAATKVRGSFREEIPP